VTSTEPGGRQGPDKDREISTRSQTGDLPLITARTKLWLEAGPRDASRSGERILGLGLVALLAGVESTGSLTKAAAGAGMSYRYAWHLVHQAEANLGQAMLVARSGGRRGGGSALSTVGRRLLGVFETLNGDVAGFAVRRLEELMRETPHDAKREGGKRNGQ